MTPAEREIQRVLTSGGISLWLRQSLHSAEWAATGDNINPMTWQELAIDAQLLADLLAARSREVEEQIP